MNKCEDKECWEIVHIPDKPPFPPHQQPTVKVYAAVIDPKLTNTLVRKLNQILPLENLRHVKRVRKECLDGGSTRLSVILCIAGENDSQLDIIPREVVELIEFYQLETFITKVCRYAPLSKEEWEEQCKIWPTSYHPPTYNICGITGFSEEESHSVSAFMKLALELAKCEGQMVNAAVIVDPSTNQVIARACDQVHSCSCFINHEVTTSPSPRTQNHDNMLLNSSATGPALLYRGVPCLNPWQWPNENSCGGSCSWHPLRHAAIVAIQSSAARDRRLFRGGGHGEDDDDIAEMEHMQRDLTCPSSKKQKTKSLHVKDDEELNSHSNGCHPELARPYLCTGYDIYLVWEPCPILPRGKLVVLDWDFAVEYGESLVRFVRSQKENFGIYFGMETGQDRTKVCYTTFCAAIDCHRTWIWCAMALVHQRVKRIFYGYPNPTTGALGSVHRLQGEKSLNHHYAVFKVMLPEEIY